MKLVYRVEQELFTQYLHDFSRKKYLDKLNVDSMLMTLDATPLNDVAETLRVSFAFKTTEPEQVVNPHALFFPGMGIHFPLLPEMQADVSIGSLIEHLTSHWFLASNDEDTRSLSNELRNPSTKTKRLEFWCHYNKSGISWTNNRIRLSQE